jgi:hypothetical protein
MIADRGHPNHEVKYTRKRNGTQSQHEPTGRAHSQKQSTNLTSNRKLTAPLTPNALHYSQKKRFLDISKKLTAPLARNASHYSCTQNKKGILAHREILTPAAARDHSTPRAPANNGSKGTCLRLFALPKRSAGSKSFPSASRIVLEIRVLSTYHCQIRSPRFAEWVDQQSLQRINLTQCIMYALEQRPPSTVHLSRLRFSECPSDKRLTARFAKLCVHVYWLRRPRALSNGYVRDERVPWTRSGEGGL